MWSPVKIARLVIFMLVELFALVALGLSGYLISVQHQFNIPVDFAVVGLIAGLFSLIIFGALTIVGFMFRGAWINRVLVEMITAAVLSLLWLIAAAVGSSHGDSFNNCGDDDLVPAAVAQCSGWAAIQGLGYLNWLLLMSYALMLLILSLSESRRGNSSIWSSCTPDAFQGRRGIASVEKADHEQSVVAPNHTSQPYSDRNHPPQSYPPQAFPQNTPAQPPPPPPTQGYERQAGQMNPSQGYQPQGVNSQIAYSQRPIAV